VVGWGRPLCYVKITLFSREIRIVGGCPVRSVSTRTTVYTCNAHLNVGCALDGRDDRERGPW
jgi:hypothetical protein